VKKEKVKVIKDSISFSLDRTVDVTKRPFARLQFEIRHKMR